MKFEFLKNAFGNPVTFGLLYLSLIPVFAVIYTFLEFDVGQNSPQRIDILDALYLSCVTITTLGYGDISPTGMAKAFCAIESVLGIIVIGFFLSSVANRVSQRLSNELDRKNDDIRNLLYGRIHALVERRRKLVWPDVGESMMLSYGERSHSALNDCRDRFETAHRDEHSLLPPNNSVEKKEEFMILVNELYRLNDEMDRILGPYVGILDPDFLNSILDKMNWQKYTLQECEDYFEKNHASLPATVIGIARLQTITEQEALFSVATSYKRNESYQRIIPGLSRRSKNSQ